MIANEPDLEQMIRDEAYRLWQSGGEPQGRDAEHWELARENVAQRLRQSASREARTSIGRHEGTGPTSSMAVLADLWFGAGGNGVPHLREGWSVPETDFVWAIRKTSCIEVARPEAEDMSLELTAGGLVVDPPLCVQLLIDGMEAGRTDFGSELSWTVPIPQTSPGTDRSLLLELRFPRTASPRDVGFGEDDRQLGLALVRMVLRGSRSPGANSFDPGS